MKPQGDCDVYFKKDYDSKARFASYWHQIQETLDLAPKKVLEIGKGSGFVSRYLKEKGATVSAFYLSNVEMYLRKDGSWESFCTNSAELPLDETSTFIRSLRSGFYGPGGLASELGSIQAETSSCK